MVNPNQKSDQPDAPQFNIDPVLGLPVPKITDEVARPIQAGQTVTPNNPALPHVTATAVPDTPLKKTPLVPPSPQPKTFAPWLKDLAGIGIFVIAVIVGAWLINALVFRSFSVVGPSMENTFFTGERIIVNRLPISFNTVAGKQFVPGRGEIIVFKNPMFSPGQQDEYIVKRVIGLPGERVTLDDCVVKVYNDQNSAGFNPYLDFDVPNRTACVSGESLDRTIGSDEIFVIGDNRTGSFSLDSRNGLGLIPLEDIVGPVSMRIWPLNKISFY
jgi:signal peptidase I